MKLSIASGATFALALALPVDVVVAKSWLRQLEKKGGIDWCFTSPEPDVANQCCTVNLTPGILHHQADPKNGGDNCQQVCKPCSGREPNTQGNTKNLLELGEGDGSCFGLNSNEDGAIDPAMGGSYDDWDACALANAAAVVP